MIRRIIFRSISLVMFLWLGACDNSSSTASTSDGSWIASFRIAAGSLSESQLQQAGWVGAVATRNGSAVAQAETTFAARSLYLKIPSGGDAEIVMTGYVSQTDRSVVWSGSGTLANGTTNPGKNVVTLSEGPAMPAILSSITAADGSLTPFFSSKTTTYTDTVDNSVTSTYVTGISADLYGTVRYAVGTGSFASTHYSTALTAGAVTPFYIKSTNSLGHSLIYTVNIFRKSCDSTLSSLTAADGSLAPIFSSKTTTYTDTVDNSVTSTYVTGVSTDPWGTLQYAVGTGSFASTRYSTPLPAGVVTPFYIKSTNSLGHSLTYTVNIFRKSCDSTLSSLTAADGSLTPFFSSKTTTYTDTVDNSVTSTYVTGVSTDPWGTLQYAVGTGSFVSTRYSTPLPAGMVTPFYIKSTNSLGHSLIYTVKIYRKPA